jgi:ribonuclease E
MVEDNGSSDNKNTDASGTPEATGPVRKKKLFGSRRPVKGVVPPAVHEEDILTAPVLAETAPAETAVVDFDEEHPGLAPLTPQSAPVDTPIQQQPRATTSLFFQAPDIIPLPALPVRSGSGQQSRDDRQDHYDDRQDNSDEPTVRRRSRRRSGEENAPSDNDPANTVVKVRTPRPEPELITEPQRIKGSTRLEAKKQRRRDGRDAGRRRPVVTEAEFLARRESVDRVMVVRAKDNKIQIGVLEDGVLVEHYVAKAQDASLIGNVYLGKVQNVLPSMEAAFVDIGRGRNAVLYSGEVDWDAAAADSPTGSQPRRIELALKPGATVLVQVTKDPVGHKGARLTSQVSLPGRYLVYVPNGSMSGISRKLPDTERARLKKILKEVLPENVGVIVRTASEGATEEQLTLDVNRLTSQWADISAQTQKLQAPALLHSEPDLLIKIVRDVFNEDFARLVISGDEARETIESYLRQVAPDLLDRVERHESDRDAFDEFRIAEQIEKALERKVWLPSGGSLVIDRTEAMTVVDVNTGKFVGSGGNLEETVTKNNLEAAEEIVRQLRLRDIGGIIVVDFIDMVLETNRDLVLRRLVECLSRDRTKHQVAEVTSLGLVQMTRKKLGLGLLESFSEACETCAGRGVIVHHDPVLKHRSAGAPGSTGGSASGQQERRRPARSGGNGQAGGGAGSSGSAPAIKTHGITDGAKSALAQIAASTIHPTTGSVEVITAEQLAAAESDAAENSSTAGTSTESGGAAGQRNSGQRGANQRGANQRGANQRSANQGGSGQSAVVEAESARAEVELNPTESIGAADEVGQDAASAEQAPRGRRGNRRSRSPRAEVLETASAESAEVAAPVAVVEAPVAEAAEAVATPENAEPRPELSILEIPVAPTATNRRRISTRDAEVLLDSVLDALPEPKQPGQGRSRSRRVSTAALSAPTPDQEQS